MLREREEIGEVREIARSVRLIRMSRTLPTDRLCHPHGIFVCGPVQAMSDRPAPGREWAIVRSLLAGLA
jgi:hypothetical protein